MYYPYFRGKQYELIAIRERASILGNNNIHPIIEPVRTDFSSLVKTINELKKHKAQYIIIINPQNGQLRKNPKPIYEQIENLKISDDDGLSLGYIITTGTKIDILKNELQTKKNYKFSMIHYGQTDGINLIKSLSDLENIKEHIFVEGYSGALYQKQFLNEKKPCILIRDGFIQRKNDTYPVTEHFSDLHLTYLDDGFNGFGDFLIVGEEYKDKGFMAFAVVIHLTYFNKEDDMHIKHFISKRTGSTDDPAGKFAEALEKLIQEKNSNSMIYNSEAFKEFVQMHKTGDYKGLGYIKKISMQHHLELMADFLSNH
jgi:hypothetical protein